MTQAQYAIIGGTGVYDPALLDHATEHTIDTPYGSASCTIGEHAGRSIAFMPRHGKGHSVPPHQINYRANLYALKEIGVTHVLATAAVGSMRLSLPPGALVIVDQFLDFTKGRVTTFFEGDKPVTHVDMTDPYCRNLRGHLQQTAARENIVVSDGGTYVCTEGPRFETPAEIRMFAQLGGDVVGMTTVPEAVLAKELGLCYATVAMVTNLCAGMSGQPLTHQEVLDEMAKNVHLLRQLFFAAFSTLDPSASSCGCRTAAGSMGE
ncbi:MAG: S-methyl-5'-thioadenosine phosphorylase [Firmicutes bacterium]|nr:S-methyl-5'-thioadenosine phosphorylase [Bacillota bacterium]